MDEQEKTLFITLGLGLVLLFFLRPKNSSIFGTIDDIKSMRTSEPLEGDKNDVMTKTNARTAINAMRKGLDDNITQKDANALQNLLLKEYNVKIILKDKKLQAVDPKTNKVIMNE
mgnify:CR=1 FL=1